MKNTPLNRRQSLAVLGSALALPSAAWAQAGRKPTQTINYTSGAPAGAGHAVAFVEARDARGSAVLVPGCVQGQSVGASPSGCGLAPSPLPATWRPVTGS